MSPKIFHYDEGKYYGFGLRLGIANFLRNGFRLGVPKTLGKILQPINSYTRFPEYHFMGSQIEAYLQGCTREHRPKILDIGSPKCFGLYLACTFNIEIHLTDIDKPAVEESAVLWSAIKDEARGQAEFSVQDVRSPTYPEGEFDIVYSMSVIEHVQGRTGDSESIREMIRLLKPGGLLLVTVPFGQRYIEQDRLGLEGAARETGDRSRHFFQRIYTSTAVEERIMNAASHVALRRVNTIRRNVGVISKLYRHIGTGVRALLGCFNPLLSAALNESNEGFSSPPSQYGDLHSRSDVYGDVVLVWEKETLATCKQSTISHLESELTA